MALQGIWFDGKTSASQSVELHMDDAGQVCVVHIADQTMLARVPFSAIKVSSRVGNTPRFLYFPDGEKFETRQHDQIDQWLQQYRPSFWNNLGHQLETHTYFVALTLVLVVTFTWAVAVYGLPAASRYIAFHLPQNVMKRAATETLQFLDKTQLKPSKLDEQTREKILAHFAPAIEQNKNLHIKVIFRAGGAIGANAFALPDGTVLFTDEIVQLSKNNDELLAVLAHEIGHVKYRHSLRSVIQGSVISFGVAMLTGDLSAASNLLATLPVIITNMSYSRDFEREADDNSLVFLDANHIERHYFVDLMERLTYQAECTQLMMGSDLKTKSKKKKSASSTSSQPSSAQSSSSQDSTASASDDDDEDSFQLVDVEIHKEQCDKLIAEHKKSFFDAKVMGYFASHPETNERTIKFKQPSQH